MMGAMPAVSRQAGPSPGMVAFRSVFPLFRLWISANTPDASPRGSSFNFWNDRYV